MHKQFVNIYHYSYHEKNWDTLFDPHGPHLFLQPYMIVSYFKSREGNDVKKLRDIQKYYVNPILCFLHYNPYIVFLVDSSCCESI
jgi:hypothetical protein